MPKKPKALSDSRFGRAVAQTWTQRDWLGPLGLAASTERYLSPKLWAMVSPYSPAPRL